MRRVGPLVVVILLISALAPAARAETCSNTLILTFKSYSTTMDTALVVSNPGSFDSGSMPTCAWHYTQPVDVATSQPAGTITDVQNSALGTANQGGFTFTPNPGYTGTAYFVTVSESGEFIQWESFISVTAGGGGGGGTVTKDACKKGGWKTLKRADGSSFKNEGDCISYANNGK